MPSNEKEKTVLGKRHLEKMEMLKIGKAGKKMGAVKIGK